MMNRWTCLFALLPLLGCVAESAPESDPESAEEPELVCEAGRTRILGNIDGTEVSLDAESAGASMSTHVSYADFLSLGTLMRVSPRLADPQFMFTLGRNDWYCAEDHTMTSDPWDHTGPVWGSVEGISELGRCRDATPVDGSLEACIGSACQTHEIRGSVDGISIDTMPTSASWYANRFDAVFDEDGVIFAHSHPVGIELTFGVIRLPSTSQDPGGVYCWNQLQRSVGDERAKRYVFSDLKRLGTCGQSPVSGHLSYCAMEEDLPRNAPD